jgi:serine/threonine protein kinase
MINPGTVLQDRYLIEKLIGEGGMGAVYLAIDQRFDNFVAIKETFYKDEEFGEAFEREAKILNGLMHPVLPHVSDYFTEGDEHYLVMQFIEGEDASDILKREGAFPVQYVLRWTDNLLDALDYLHSQEPPIIHRDLKPSNLKITARGDIFLLDFGLAKLKKENTLSERSVFGYSRRYSPLEQIQGTGTDARSDIFALAATIFHLMTGTPPVDAIARASSIVAGKPDPIRLASEIKEEIPASFAHILNVALSLNAENRFASANAMRQAFKHAVQGIPEENVQSVPEIPVKADAINENVITPADNENFPALAAFAEAVEAPEEIIEVADEEPSPIEIPIQTPTASENLPVRTANDFSNQYESRPKQRSRFPIAALIALSAFILTASAFFMFRNRKTGEQNPAPTQISTETKTDSEQSENTAETAEKTTIPDSSETREKVRTKPVVEKKTTVEKASVEEAPVEENIRETTTSKPSNPELKHRAPKSNTPGIDRRERVVKSEPVPDIESIFTGRSSWEREEKMRRREERRRMNEQMSDEELRKWRRRRQARREIYNPIPF